MRIEDLEIFLATVQTGSFTRAAEKLSLSKQYVSRRMDALEASLGVQLFVRNTRSLRITDLGHELRAHAQHILGAVGAAERAISERRDRLQGRLKITVPMSFGLRYLAPVLSGFSRQHPSVQLQVEVNDLFADLIGEDFDMALRIGRLPDSSLIARKLGELPMYACCSPDYARRHGVPATPHELAGHQCLLYGREGQSGWQFNMDGNPLTVPVQGPMVANNGEFLCDAALAGCGIAFLPSFIVEAPIQAGLLVPVLQAYSPAPLQVSVVYPHHRQGSLLVQTLFDFIRLNLPASSFAPRVLPFEAQQDGVRQAG
ncbi:LysR family transcriptional regulator [Orrella sp. JC864]|uniref:LysR family transcriptional regulator n=1 Tax=Orrella sp. JC864 TaxID=3120298 RepID=UPI00300ABFCF